MKFTLETEWAECFLPPLRTSHRPASFLPKVLDKFHRDQVQERDSAAGGQEDQTSPRQRGSLAKVTLLRGMRYRQDSHDPVNAVHQLFITCKSECLAQLSLAVRAGRLPHAVKRGSCMRRRAKKSGV